ncbi:C39 family peptidase [Nocardioides conyzicola]|uniref:Peptidase C39-like domain-containing protein n=1 Tax=Nocardioides conyzicola TaxID=1651781 RepID=A0ABP8XIW6_9ACTN
MSRPRAIAVAVGVLALLLALTPFVPRGDDDKGSLRPSGDRVGAKAALLSANTVGRSRVTPAMQAEIDRVVAAGRALGRTGTKAGLARRAAELVRCAELDGQRYCLGVGWTDDTEADVRARVATAARVAARSTSTTTTGDLDASDALARTASMKPAARAAAERAELESAARSVAKVWLLRHEIQGVALPADFLARHPEARAAAPTSSRTTKPTATPTPTASATPTRTPKPTASASPTAVAPSKTKKGPDYPRRAAILNPHRVAEQTRTYWCGPTSMQMIAWGWAGKAHSQDYWAKKLGTTTSGTGITAMVQTINRSTGWDSTKYAGSYITLDIGDWTYKQWMLLMMRHIVDYRAPVVLHPILHKAYYPYLDDDGSGHYQVGRGYDKNGKKPALLGYFEPWNQQRFDPSEPYIDRVQWRNAYKSYRANEAHYLHNIGV